MCNSASSANTFSDVVKETNFYYFIYSTHTQSYETKVSLQVDMAFTSLDSLEESNIYSNCIIIHAFNGHQLCTIDIPSDFVGAAALATSAPDQTDQPEVYGKTHCQSAGSVILHLIPLKFICSYLQASLHSYTSLLCFHHCA